jgi:hypothetical protein
MSRGTRTPVSSVAAQEITRGNGLVIVTVGNGEFGRDEVDKREVRSVNLHVVRHLDYSWVDEDLSVFGIEFD